MDSLGSRSLRATSDSLVSVMSLPTEVFRRLAPAHSVSNIPYVPNFLSTGRVTTNRSSRLSEVTRNMPLSCLFVSGEAPVSLRVCDKPLFLCTAPVNRRSGDLSAF